ncbi:MAG: phosphoribosyl-AMP cyclohydrolase [Altererythrobacter sp.]|nr:phosphoribosyl-AMP cyclohydrolase [Altererythrobacter sp.]NNE50516.1 phosphoribosyl-AMP cyclohydrolase [Altererythrobacter sp.]NNF93922.1 phosphoribosyl-AMP cyclohydrolase [Altererythrobacter sp.]
MTDHNGGSEAPETTLKFRPKFNDAGLVTAVVIEALTKDVLMVAHMNAQAIAQTQSSGIAHFWSRSRQELWMKGGTSGNTLSVTEMRTDCDQDAVLLYVDPAGPACHTGEHSCFYRIVRDGTLVRVKI